MTRPRFSLVDVIDPIASPERGTTYSEPVLRWTMAELRRAVRAAAARVWERRSRSAAAYAESMRKQRRRQKRIDEIRARLERDGAA